MATFGTPAGFSWRKSLGGKRKAKKGKGKKGSGGQTNAWRAYVTGGKKR
jgi:hypothetical protein